MMVATQPFGCSVVYHWKIAFVYLFFVGFLGGDSYSCVTGLEQCVWGTEEVVDVVWPMGCSFHTRHCCTRHQKKVMMCIDYWHVFIIWNLWRQLVYP